MDISCGLPPRPDIAEIAAEAERLGYRRIWLFDSAALYGDVWVHLALCAQATTHIGLGPAVIVPGFRHPLAQASAIATLEQLAPGRTVAAIGTGFTGRFALGKKPHTWAKTTVYIDAVQRLLAGEDVEVDGAVNRMIPPETFLPGPPFDVPIVVAANGPKGLAAAAELDAAGIMTLLGPQAGWDWCAQLVFGTVLDEGEGAGSRRAVDAAGACAAAVIHATYEGGPEAVDSFEGGAQWRASLETVPEPIRHLALHEDHMVTVTERDRPLLTGDFLRAFTWTGTADEVAGRVDAFAAGGGTEVLYSPSGPDVMRELRKFAAAAGAASD